MNDSHPWWLWPNLLSLDAPAVAVAWQVFLASAAGVAVPLAATAVLGLVVWAVYLADRGFDARRGAAASDRHSFAGRHATACFMCAGAALAVAGALAAVALPSAYLAVGAAVALATVVYFAAVHLAGGGVFGPGLKEAAVGAVFAAGVVIPLLAADEPPGEWLPGAAAFAALCWLNCALISLWEGGRGAAPLWCAGVAAATAVTTALGSELPVRAAVLGSAAALGLLHAARPRLSPRARRVLADAALLSPIPVVLLT